MKRRKRKFKEDDEEFKRRPGRRRASRDDEDNYRMLRPNLSPFIKRWIAVIIIFGISVLSILALFDVAGKFGTYLKRGLVLVFGWSAFIFPVILMFLGYFLLTYKKRYLRATHYIGFVLLVLSYSGILHLSVLDQGREAITGGRGGGYLGYAISYPLNQLTGVFASYLVLVIFLLISFLIIFESWIIQIQENGFGFRFCWRIKGFFQKIGGKLTQKRTGEEKSIEFSKSSEAKIRETEETRKGGEVLEKSGLEKAETLERSETEKIKRARFISSSPQPFVPKIEIPLKILNDKGGEATSGDIESSKTIIQKTLANFGISVEMAGVSIGPTVTQYTLKPAGGIKLSQITTLQNDLALALAAHPIRIEAPIPGKSLVGIEVPNKSVAVVTLREILEHEVFKQRKSNLTIALGKDVAGQPWLADLGKMPHMLVAGATGSGKTVCLNAIIVSLLYQNSPKDLSFILIDPKRVEFTAYNGIPHLLTPAITDVTKTISALKWSIGEMERRFHLLSEVGKRDINAYNAVFAEKMPYIAIIIDELADLMVASAAEVEALIIRLAQMARAVGIHLIMATQRPSVDVITGLIKANITTRIAFSVASIMDSRTILDNSGAEKLLGRGDMLYISAELSKPRRLQGAYLSDREVDAVTRFLRERGEPDYNEEVVSQVQAAGSFGSFGGVDISSGDELLEQAKEVIIRAGKASASLLQRRLRVGYARAARLLDLLEEQGIIGPADGAKPRDLLVAPEEEAADFDRNEEPNNAYGSDEVEEENKENEEEDDYDYEDEEDGGSGESEEEYQDDRRKDS